MSLVVSELFGPTIQGEGPHAGRLAHFVRLGGCNLSCSWCDTPYTWDASRHDLRAELRRVEVDEVLTFLEPACHIVITGGEPLLQAADVVDIVREYRMPSNGTVIEVETNGTLPPPPWAPYVEWNVSPKLEHAGVEARALHPAWRFTAARYKFVVTGVEDLDEIARFKLPPRHAVTECALDSGGFTELKDFGSWDRVPAASYVAASRRYFDSLGSVEWIAPQDWMCEPAVINGGTFKRMRFVGTRLSVAEHQRLTVENYIELRTLAPDLPWRPVLQGWTLDDYLRCIDLYDSMGVDLFAEPLVGLGSVCRRQATREIAMICSVLGDTGLLLHGFGVKTDGLATSAHYLESADSQAWAYGGHMTHRRGCDCTRCEKRPQDQLRHCGSMTHKNEANCMIYAMAWRKRVLAAIDTPKQLAFGAA